MMEPQAKSEHILGRRFPWRCFRYLKSLLQQFGLICCLPAEIQNSETIVRAILFPAHIKDGKLKSAAFKSPSGKDEVSIVRHTHMGTDFCKRRATGLSSKRVQYVGLAVVTAAQIRDADAQVTDSRNVYCGHGDISYGIVAPPRDEPSSSATNLLLNERARKIASSARYYKDPLPNSSTWTGSPLLPR